MNAGQQFTIAPLDQKWNLLQSADPARICQDSGAQYDQQGFYVLQFMDTECEAHPRLRRVVVSSGGMLAHDANFVLLAVNYLLSARAVPLSGSWVSEKQLKGGSFFFRGPHALPVESLVQRFGRSAREFVCTGLARGGTEIAGHGDAALRFLVLPRIPVTVILWTEDEEFPARMTFLFDASLDSQLPLDMVLALVHCMTVRLLSSDP